MATKVHVLVVEDNSDMRIAVTRYLADHGYVVSGAASAEIALENEYHTKADIAIVDISLPGMTGIDLTKKLKEQGFDAPIIAITARDSIDDKIIGLNAGMNDYVIKPFDLRELTARINAQLRTNGVHHGLSNIETTHYRIVPKQHKFYANGVLQKLTLVEFRLMLKLMQHNHTTVATQDLIEAAWGEDAATVTPPIRIHISNLRAKLQDTSLTIIQTVPGIGYMLKD